MYFRYYLTKKRALHLTIWANSNPLYLWTLFAKLKLFQWFWRKRWKCKTFTNRRTDDRQHVIRNSHLNFQLKWGLKRGIGCVILHVTCYSNEFKNWRLYFIIIKQNTSSACQTILLFSLPSVHRKPISNLDTVFFYNRHCPKIILHYEVPGKFHNDESTQRTSYNFIQL